MTCREMSDFLAEYVAGELPQEVLIEFEGHISRCGDCDVFIAQYRSTIRAGALAFQEHETLKLPEPLVAAIMAALQRK